MIPVENISSDMLIIVNSMQRAENPTRKFYLLECSYVLISIFGLSSKEVDELEKHHFCGLTSAELDSIT